MSEVQLSKFGYVVSDLHVFGCNSLYERYLPQFYKDVESHPIAVLNGDTFDFKRSKYRTANETADRALTWLHDLSHRAPQTKFFFIVGNHDSNQALIKVLDSSHSALPNFHLAIDSLRLGPCLFLHGDAVDLPASTHDLAVVRAGYIQAEPNTCSRIFAQVVTHLRVNRIEFLRHSKKTLASRLTHYLDATCPGYREVVREVYFGHTHVPFSKFQYQGINFYNTGSMIRGLPWRPLKFTFSEHDSAATGSNPC